MRRVAAAMVVTLVGSAGLLAAAMSPAAADTQTFGSPGAGQSFQVPPGVTSLTVDVVGADGGKGSGVGTGGDPGEVIATIAVTPCETLTVGVGGIGGPAGVSPGAAGVNGGGAGGPGSSGDNGAGGGGQSDIGRNGTPLVVAGGGGGGAITNSGGDGGGADGTPGTGGSGPVGGAGQPGTSGGPGSGGAPGGGIATAGADGTPGHGGTGGTGNATTSGGGGGGGAGFNGAGGGGGGAVGADGGGGGGGSGFVEGSATGVTVHQGVASPNGGNGQVTVTNDPGSGSCPAPSGGTAGAAVAVVGVPRFTG